VFSLADSPRQVTVALGSIGARSDDHVRNCGPAPTRLTTANACRPASPHTARARYRLAPPDPTG